MADTSEGGSPSPEGSVLPDTDMGQDNDVNGGMDIPMEEDISDQVLQDIINVEPGNWVDREQYPQTFFGDVHDPPPQPGDPSRPLIFSKPWPIEAEQVVSVVDDWLFCVNGPEGTNPLEKHALGLHLRPSTPRDQRATRQFERMMADEAYFPEDDKIVWNHQVVNSGAIESLRHYAEGKKSIPIDNVNKIMETMDRSRLEHAGQMSCVERELKLLVDSHARDTFHLQTDLENANKHLQDLEASKTELESELYVARERANDMEADCNQALLQGDGYLTRIQMQDQETQTLQAEYDQLRLSAQKLQSEHDQLQADATTRGERVSELETKASEYELTFQTQKLAMEKQQKQIDELRRQLAASAAGESH